MIAGKIVMIIGIIMFAIGLVLFYSIELGQTNPVLRLIKNVGTFVGLSGMGVALAGILLYLINKNEPPIKENFDV
ncbi:MAG TPA: hypothetical protein OQH54_05200 [Nitrosopumilus sp.]|nr:hypothetical protein [Thermoproteota archaeon]HJJ23095.1 hypothetical protein [Nitrosopumilus sp.]